jgi:hypothetical protein
MEMEQEHIDQDHSDISESQSPSPDEKNCKYCRTLIQPDASVCQYCRYHQRWWLNFFPQFGFIVSIALLGLSIWQFRVALEQRTKADEALHRASVVEQLAKQTQSLLEFNLLLTKAISDDRKAFDELWEISQTPQHTYQDLARRAVETMVWSTITFPRDSALIDKLQKLGYTELLQYYRKTPHVHSPSILYAADGNKHMTEEEKADFIAIMIDEDGSFRVVQRACSVIRERLELYEQAKPARHDRVVNQCTVYGKLWEQALPRQRNVP